MAFVVVLALWPTSWSLAAEKMPSADSYPHQNMGGIGQCEDRSVARMNMDTEESVNWPVYAAAFWFYLDDGPKQDNPFAVAIFDPSVPDGSNDKIYIDFNRDGKADQVLSGLEVDEKYGEEEPLCVLVKAVN